MLVRRLTLLAAAAVTVLLAACATGPKPEAFVAEACMEATAAESLAEQSARQQEQLASQLEEHQARLVELQRMRSRIVTGRMTDEELAQWEPERLPWEEEPEPEPVPVDTVATEPELSETAPSDSMMTAESDSLSEFESYDAAGDTTEAGMMPDEMEAGSDSTDAGSSFEGTDEVESGDGESLETSDQMNDEAPADAGTDAMTEPVEDSGDAAMSGDSEQAAEEQTGDQSDTGGTGEESTDTGETP